MAQAVVTFADPHLSRRHNALATQLHSSTGALETPKKQILGTQKKDTVPENKLPICERPWFNAMMGVIIALNAIEIGIQTDAEDPHHLVFETLNIFFVLIYIAELTVRIYYNRAEYFSSAFNIFDCVLVIKTIVETFILSDSALKSLLSLRLVRMIRLIRMVRLLRFFRELWLVFTGVIAMLKTLAWVALLLFSLTWVCAIILRMVLGQSNAWSFANRLTAEPYEYFDTYEYFGTPWAGLLTLFQVTTQDHWMVSIARPVGRTYPVMWLFFLPYLFITAYAILNVMLSSIVNNAIDAAKANEKQLKIQKSRAQAKVMLKLRRIFEEIDVDENGKLDKEELDEAANNPKIISLLAEINMPVNDLNRVFECLDADGDGEVNRDEFLHGCAKLRGEPKARDVNRIPIYIQSLASRIDWYEQKVDALADEVLFILEYKMREAGVDANHFERRQGSSAAMKALDHLALAGVTAADRVRGLELEALEALRREALKRSMHRAPKEFGVNLNEVRIDRSHIPFALPIGGENLLRTLPSMKLPPAKTIDRSKEEGQDEQRSVEPCVAHLPTLPPPPKPPPVVSILEVSRQQRIAKFGHFGHLPDSAPRRRPPPPDDDDDNERTCYDALTTGYSDFENSLANRALSLDLLASRTTKGDNQLLARNSEGTHVIKLPIFDTAPPRDDTTGSPTGISLDVADVSALVSLLNAPTSTSTEECEAEREVRLLHHLRRMQRSAVEGICVRFYRLLRSLASQLASHMRGPRSEDIINDPHGPTVEEPQLDAADPYSTNHSTDDSDSGPRRLVASRAKCQRIFDRLYSDAVRQRERRIADAEQKRQEEQRWQAAQCPFSPRILGGDSSLSPVRAATASERLYRDATDRRQRRRRVEQGAFNRNTSGAITPSKSASAISDRLHRDAERRRQKRAELVAKFEASFSPDCSKSRRSFQTLVDRPPPGEKEVFNVGDYENEWGGRDAESREDEEETEADRPDSEEWVDQSRFASPVEQRLDGMSDATLEAYRLLGELQRSESDNAESSEVVAFSYHREEPSPHIPSLTEGCPHCMANRRPSIHDQLGAFGITDLHVAAYEHDTKTVGELLEKCADPNKQDMSLVTPLHAACQQPNSCDVVRTLLRHRADVLERDSIGHTPLHWAAFACETDTVKLLLIV
ncbi:hypothetical protein FOL46_001986 [Perkinsus olseni]|uniref:EF-hand domain-containing protein n=1 Tax=Perkinsus olseni TaxID=32597 RepID=A0A7J6MV14_PEROL|nr:hypothetical protein FOL46_001986 [Perkinsus olseni]